jgi:hypothetical protein
MSTKVAKCRSGGALPATGRAEGKDLPRKGKDFHPRAEFFRLVRRSRFGQARRRRKHFSKEELAIALAAGNNSRVGQGGARMETRVHFPLAWIV